MAISRNVIVALAVFILFAGAFFAIDNASIGNVVQTRWLNNATAGNSTTQGGNISVVNISETTLTNRWAAYSGNVTGTIALTDGSANVFTWNWQPANGGKICLSTGSTFNFGSLVNASQNNISTGMNTAWGFGSATDNATNTYTLATCGAMNFVQAAVAAGTATAGIQGASNFLSCAIATALAPTTKPQFAFCTNINTNGKNYKNNSVNYEVMVPTPYSFGGTNTETYYFYGELN